MEKILVTGGNGYKGSVLIPRLLKKGYFIRSIDTNWFGDYLENHKNLEKILLDIRNIDIKHLEGISTIIHLANIANDPAVELSPLLSWEVNVLASQLLCSHAKDAGVKNIIFASSGSVYGISDKEKVIEETPLVPISEYNKTKMIAERVFMSYSNAMKIYCIRPATVCGVSPRMRLDVAVNILTYSALKHGTINVFGGDQTRPNIHISDICNVYEFFLKNNNKIDSGFYNAGFENISILDIAKIIKTKLKNIEIKISPSNDPRSYRQCSDKLLKLGFVPEKNVEDAIDEIILSYNQNFLNTDSSCYTVNRMRELKIK